MTKTKILIVEDERIVAADIQRSLQSVGYAVSAVVSSGKEAVSKAEELKPDLVLMDIVLSGDGNGIQAAAQIHSLDIPIVYLTAYAQEETLQRAKATEPYGYIVKPFNDRELRSTVEMALHRHKTEEALRESERRYRNLIERSLQGLFIFQGSPPHIVFANKTMSEILGYTIDELTSLSPKEVREALYREDRKRVLETYRDRMEGKPGSQPLETRIIRKDGRECWVELLGSRIEYNGKAALQVSCVDITERKRAEKALLAAAQQWRSTFDAIGDAVYLTDPNGKILRCNKAMTNLLEKSFDEIVGHHCWEVVHGASEPIEGCPLVHMRKTRRRESIVLPMDDKVVTVTVDPLSDEGGNLTGAVHIITDITERKRAEETLKRKTRQQDQLIESARHLTESLDVKEVLTRIGTGAKEILKAYACSIYFLEDDGKTLTPMAVIDPAYEQEVQCTTLDIESSFTGKSVKARQGLIFNDAATNPDGKHIPGTPLEKEERVIAIPFIVDHKVLGAMCLNRRGEFFSEEDLALAETFATYATTALENAQMYRDLQSEVSVRKQAEETLKESEEKYRTLFETSPDGIFTTELNGKILEANKAFQDMLGYTLEELQKIAHQKITPPKWHHEVTKRIKSTIAKGYDTFEKEYIRKDDTVFPVALTGWIIKDKQRKPKRLGMFVRDITERKRAEEELKKSYQKLQSLLEEIVHVLATAVEMRDPYTAGHQRRVAVLASAIAGKMSLPKEQRKGLRLAAIIHDIGKIYVPAEILSRPGSLTDIEFGLIKIHPQAGYDLLKPIEFPWPVAQIVLQHHERIDGSGFPQGLKGEDILLEARILAVADVVEAMSSHRPYRPAHGIESTLEEISQNKGVLYDPRVADACLEVFAGKEFKFEQDTE